MNTIVVYNSRTGFTEKYAQWIADGLECRAFPYKDAKNSLDGYEQIIYGEGVIAGILPEFRKIKKTDVFRSKKIILFATGATDIRAVKMIEKIKNTVLTSEEQERIPFFFFESGINYEKMSFFPKTLLRTMYKILSKKKNPSPEERGMIKVFKKSCDNCRQELTEALLETAAQQS